MIRDVRFRAWDSECEEMFYSDKEYDDRFFEFKDGNLFCFTIIENGDAGSIHEPPSPFCEKLDNLMQFTGIKDKNGNEVWEGDIIKKGSARFSVEFRDGAFEIIGINIVSVARLSRDYRDIEVIGNIYEQKMD